MKSKIGRVKLIPFLSHMQASYNSIGRNYHSKTKNGFIDVKHLSFFISRRGGFAAVGIRTRVARLATSSDNQTTLRPRFP